ncbi:MAG: hypothetical protein ACN4GW_21130 [Desulforhopalus sp.]
MNFYYIDFMIRERQKLEREETERKRMLRIASEQDTGSAIIKKVLSFRDIALFRMLIPQQQNISAVTLSQISKPETVSK